MPMAKSSNIFLIGPMGAGKSTIGRHLAKSMGVEFVDSDLVIEQRTGANIPLIFEVEGEDGFRRREKAAIDELTQRERIVLATGGGVVLDPENRRHLASRGTVVYLYAAVDQLAARTGKDRRRPLLYAKDPRERLEELMKIRDPLYREIADLIVDTGGRTIQGAEKDILSKLHPSKLASTRKKSRSSRRQS